MTISVENLARLRGIKLFLCDVDGVLTDGTVMMGQGRETKTFDIRDGLGLKLLQQEGIKVGWISARPSTATDERALDLKVDFVRQSSASKVAVIEEILEETGLAWSEISFMGDDVLDLGVLRRAGFSAAPADAREEARRLAHYTCSLGGGRGAVREVAEMVLRAQGRLEGLLAKFAS
jgi:3-deoxy-D-manno-octulosonate 8-phosphate phosphatase (KDO 8-P phosphatase)